MRVVLEVLSGSNTGKKLRLGAGHVVQVGRTEWADWHLPGDGHMSGVHFEVHATAVACYIRDLGSSNGTMVNGQQLVEKAELCNGDQIQTGETLFSVRVQEDPFSEPLHVVSQKTRPGLAPVPGLGGMAPGKQRPKVAYSVEKCDSGLTLCRGNVDEIQPHELAAVLGRTFPAYLIVDFKKMGSKPPEELDPPDYLFDWLDPGVVSSVSPVVVSQEDFGDWPTLIENGWDEDAVICLFSKQEKPALLEHLRTACRGKTHAEDQGRGIVGYCWPSVMAPLLAHYTPDFVERLLDGIDAVLVELPDLPITWQVYGRDQLPEVLDGLGFARQQTEEVTSSEEVTSQESED